jgi:hypothetical protein
MQVTINGIDIEFNFSIRSINEIVQYKKFYEPHDRVTLTQYLSRIDDENYSIDNLCDMIFYAHAVKFRNIGKQPVINYADVLEWILSHMGEVQHVLKNYTESLPQSDEAEAPAKKKKTVRLKT